VNKVWGRDAEYNDHQPPVYQAISYETSFRVSLARVFPNQHGTLEHHLSRQQRQPSITDIGFVFNVVAGEFHRSYNADARWYPASD